MAKGKVLRSRLAWSCATKNDILCPNGLGELSLEVCMNRKNCCLTKTDRKRYCRKVRVTVEDVK